MTHISWCSKRRLFLPGRDNVACLGACVGVACWGGWGLPRCRQQLQQLRDCLEAVCGGGRHRQNELRRRRGTTTLGCWPVPVLEKSCRQTHRLPGRLPPPPGRPRRERVGERGDDGKQRKEGSHLRCPPRKTVPNSVEMVDLQNKRENNSSSNLFICRISSNEWIKIVCIRIKFASNASQ